MRQEVLQDTLPLPRTAPRADPAQLLSARHDRAAPRVIRKFRPDIEGLRAVAVTLVVLSHLGLVFPGGYVGFDVFFVISGFLITRQLTAELTRTNRISFARFYARRVRRILPAAAVVIVGTLLACWRRDSPLRVKSDALDAGPAHAVAAAPGLRAVDDALAAAVKLTRLPADVTPSLSAAPNDFSFTTNDCMAAQLPTAPPPDGTCTFGDPRARRTIVVVGDSHANAWSPAIDAFAKDYHWRFILYAKAACPPGVYPTFVSPVTSQIYSECNQWRQNVFARLKELKPAVILVTAQIRTIDIDPDGMVQSIREFEATGARVIYLEDTPEPIQLGSVPDCLAARQ